VRWWWKWWQRWDSGILAGGPLQIETFRSLGTLCPWTDELIDLLIDYLRFYVPLKNFSLIWRRLHYRWRAAKFRPMLVAQGLWAGRDLYRATPTVTWDLGFSGLIRRTAPFSRLLRHTRGCGGSILTRILTGLTSGYRLGFFQGRWWLSLRTTDVVAEKVPNIEKT
jgi:hypothetical protein